MIAWLWDHFQFVLPLLVITLGLVGLGHYVFCRALGIDAGRQILDQQSLPLALMQGAFLVGLAIGLEALFFGRHAEPLGEAIARLSVEGLVVIPLLLASIWINDRLVLHRVDVITEIKERQNFAIALGVAGSCIASGLVIDGVLTGYSETLLQAVLDIFVFWCIAQSLMVGAAWLFQRTQPYDLQDMLQHQPNLAMGLSLFGFLISVGFIARAAIVHAGMYPLWVEAIASCCLTLGGTGLLMLARWVLVPLFLGRRNYLSQLDLDNNYAGAGLLSCVQIAIALLISAALQRPWFSVATG